MNGEKKEYLQDFNASIEEWDSLLVGAKCYSTKAAAQIVRDAISDKNAKYEVEKI